MSLVGKHSRAFMLRILVLLALLPGAAALAAEPKNLTEKFFTSPLLEAHNLCPAGSFIDLANGGGCYTCPAGYLRSAAHINAANACYQPAGEQLLRANRHKQTPWPHECASGQFHDVWDGGACWSCPSGARRTAHPVSGERACSLPVGERHARASKLSAALASAPAAGAGQSSWQQLPGAASEIGMGGGSLWVVGSKAVQGGREVLRWDGQGWVDMKGGAESIAVDPQGQAWVVTDKGEIYRHNGTTWGQVQGQARDVGIGAEGSVWVIGSQAVQGGFQILRWNNGNWQLVPGGGVRIDVDAQGNAWVVSAVGDVFRYGKGGWTPAPGVKANDIGIGGDGSVFVAARDGSVHRWNGQGWVRRDGSLAALTVDARGVPFGISANQQIWMGQP